MTGIREWSVTAGSNLLVGGVSIAEGMSRAMVNNAMRAIMADGANFLLDIGGGISTTGSANAYAITLASVPTTVGDNLPFIAKASFGNSGAATINVNSLGATNIKKIVAGVATALASGDIPSGHRMELIYSSADSAFLLLNPALVTLSSVTGTLPIANGGTGQATATAAFQALSPLTSQGDLIRGGAAGPERVALGSSGQYFGSDGTDAKWTTFALTTSNFAANVVDTDATFAADSDSRLSSQRAIKAYVDTTAAGISWAAGGAVAVASTANLTLSGEQTIDGVLTSASRILVKNQSTATQNGVYVTAAGAWSRATDADAGAEFIRLGVFVNGGSTQAGTTWVCTRTTAPTLGVDNIAFVQNGASAVYTAGAGLGLAGNQFSITDAELLALLGLTSAADRLPYFTGTGTAALATFTAAGRALVDDADANAQLVTLGLANSTTDNAIARFDSTAGHTQNSGVIVDDSNNVSGIGTLSASISTAATIGTLTSTDATATAGPNLVLDRNSASPAANDLLGVFRMDGRDSGGNTTQYGAVTTKILDPTDGSEDAEVEIFTFVAGTQARRVNIGAGLYTTNATGGDKGIDSINASTIFRDNVAVPTISSADALTGKSYTSNTAVITLADDAATSVTFNLVGGIAWGVAVVSGNSSGANAGIGAFRVGTTPFTSAMPATSGVIWGTGALAGTTGPDGNLNIATHTDGKLYIENRTGNTRSYSIAILALVPGASIASIP